MGVFSALPDLSIFNQLPKSSMGIAVRELFNDAGSALVKAGGVAVDLLTFPVRATLDSHDLLVRDDAKEAVRHNYAPTSEGRLALVSSLTPVFSVMVGGGVLFVGGAEHLPLAAGAALGFQYAMDLGGVLIGHNRENFRVLPSLEKR